MRSRSPCNLTLHWQVPDGMLELGVVVEFAVSTVNSVGEGVRSAVSAPIVPPTAPGMPFLIVRTLAASGAFGASVSVSWNASKLPAGDLRHPSF